MLEINQLVTPSPTVTTFTQQNTFSATPNSNSQSNDSVTGWIILLVIIFVFWYFNKKKKVQQKSEIKVGSNSQSSNSSVIENGLINEQDFNKLLLDYKNTMESVRDDAVEMEKVATKFDNVFLLASKLFSFCSFIYGNYSQQDSATWWQSKYVNLADITKEKDGIIINLEEIEIIYSVNRRLWFDEFASRHEAHSFDEFDESYYNFDRTVAIRFSKKKNLIYDARGYDYRISSTPPTVPSSLHVRTFKPARWLLVLYNTMFKFKEEEQLIETRKNQVRNAKHAEETRKRYLGD